MKAMLKLYGKLCDEYNKGNYQRYCSLQVFLNQKYNNQKDPIKKSLILDVINYAKTDF